MSAALVEAQAPGDVRATVDRVTAALAARGITLFAAIDHAAGARAAGLALPDLVVLVFGNATGGTPVMQADPRAGLDLPLRMLVWSDAGTTRVAYRDPTGLAEQFHLDGVGGTLERLRALLDQLLQVAVTAG
jgi:uncharacterized protein (DUF302 family)